MCRSGPTIQPVCRISASGTARSTPASATPISIRRLGTSSRACWASPTISPTSPPNRADARGRDGGVREELAEGVVLRSGSPLSGGDLNRSTQHLLILLDKEVADGDVTDIVHGEAGGRTLGALEERTKCVGHLPGAGKEEQDRRPADRGSQWRDRSGAASQSCGGVEA